MSEQQRVKTPEATVTCIKWGNKFPAYYVNRLYAGVKRHMDRPFRFVCFTENAEGLRPEIEVFPLPVVPFEDAMVRDDHWQAAWIMAEGDNLPAGRSRIVGPMPAA
ncbi:MAG: hypothetical protein R3D34_19195 [Nitratireductor sp.]